MTYPEYRADLQRIHASEVYGTAVFSTAARLTWSSDRKRKWRVLQALEEAMLARYLDHMQRSGQPVKAPTGWALKGYVEGAALGLMPWPLAMRLLRDGTQPFLACFGRLKAHAQGDDVRFFTAVYAHERAIEAYARAELAGKVDSLKAVEGLLARWEAHGPSGGGRAE